MSKTISLSLLTILSFLLASNLIGFTAIGEIVCTLLAISSAPLTAGLITITIGIIATIALIHFIDSQLSQQHQPAPPVNNNSQTDTKTLAIAKPLEVETLLNQQLNHFPKPLIEIISSFYDDISPPKLNLRFNIWIAKNKSLTEKIKTIGIDQEMHETNGLRGNILIKFLHLNNHDKRELAEALNTPDEYGLTALIRAVSQNLATHYNFQKAIEYIILLIKNGANPTIVMTKGRYEGLSAIAVFKQEHGTAKLNKVELSYDDAKIFAPFTN